MHSLSYPAKHPNNESNFSLFSRFYCHQNTDGSLPANETGDRISTVLFYVSTVTAFMCKKLMMNVGGNYLLQDCCSNVLEEFPCKKHRDCIRAKRSSGRSVSRFLQHKATWDISIPSCQSIRSTGIKFTREQNRTPRPMIRSLKRTNHLATAPPWPYRRGTSHLQV